MILHDRPKWASLATLARFGVASPLSPTPMNFPSFRKRQLSANAGGHQQSAPHPQREEDSSMFHKAIPDMDFLFGADDYAPMNINQLSEDFGL